jgi:hypothetical protein
MATGSTPPITPATGQYGNWKHSPYHTFTLNRSIWQLEALPQSHPQQVNIATGSTPPITPATGQYGNWKHSTYHTCNRSIWHSRPLSHLQQVNMASGSTPPITPATGQYGNWKHSPYHTCNRSICQLVALPRSHLQQGHK